VGKTLLVRLIRYCLGDVAFCTKATRAAITDRWEHAYVLAHIRVECEDWMIARPMGLDASSASSFAARSADPVSVRTESEARVGFATFVDRLEATVSTAFADFELPHLDRLDRRARWPDFLGWLIRDQHCRYRHPAEWRDPDSEAGVAALHKDDASLIIRMAVGLFDKSEKDLATSHQALLAKKDQADRDLTDLDHFLAHEGKIVAKSVQDLDATLPGPLIAEGAKQRAETKLKELQRLQRELDDSTAVSEAERSLTRSIEIRSQVAEQVRRLEDDLQVTQQQLAQLRTASNEQFYASFDPAAGRYCHFYNIKADADAAGCPGRTLALPVGQRDPRHIQKISDTEQHERGLLDEIAGVRATLDQRVADEAVAVAALTQARRTYRDTLRGVAEAIGRASERQGRAAELGEAWKRLDRIETRIVKLNRQIDDSREAQQKVRAALERRRKALSERFATTLQHVLGHTAEGEVTIDGHGIRPIVSDSVAVGGEAMATSATVLGFDIACLLSAADGAGCVPGFLCHDSPREADMEEQIYHRLFHYLRELESESGGSFQYIVTTTSPPPPDVGAPFVRLKLSARKPDGLLLRQRF
jgi:ribosome-associated translation inhibitor RaiA